jgi:hypothetical protein
MYAVGSIRKNKSGEEEMIFTRRFGALAARPQFPDSPELQQELNLDVDLDRTDETRRDDEHQQPVRETTAA